jgi:hypothetical protein
MGRAMSTASFSDRHFLSANILLAPLCGLVAAFSLVGPATAQTKIEPASTNWTVSKDFEKNDKARTNLSGAACTTKAPTVHVMRDRQ